MLLVIGCASSAADESVDSITIADSTGDWGYPSPYGHYARGPGYIRMSLIFDTLVWKDEKGFVPALAESWEYLSDEKAYVFHLREGVTWNDGEPFTAKDVAFTYRVYQRPSLSMGGFRHSGKCGEQAMTAPSRSLLPGIMLPSWIRWRDSLPILPEHVYKDVSDPTGFNDPKALTGTGPFKLVNYDKAQGTYLYEANEDYYQGAPRVKQIKFVKVSTEMSAAALKKGDVDAASVPGETVDDLKEKGFVVVKGSHDWLAKIMVNHMKAPFSDAKFRQALYYAINRQDLVKTGLRGYGLDGSPGLYASDNEWYNPDQEQYTYDPAKAGELLEEMGYEKKDGSQYYTKVGEPEALELLVTATNERQGELVAKQLDSAGIKVNLRSVDSKTLDSLVGDWKFDLAFSGHGGMGADPNMLNRYHLDLKSFNSARYDDNPELNEILESQVEEMDQDKRKELVDSAQEIIAQDLPALPLYYTDSFWASNDKVSFYYTYGGVGSGVPIALNKMIFV